VALTSPALVAVLCVVTAALLVSVLRWWDRLAGRGARPVLLRVAALCAVQLSLLSLIFVVVNQSAEFYASWSDLLGTDTGGGAITATGTGSGHVAGYRSGHTTSQVIVTGSSGVAAAGPRGAGGTDGGRLQAVRIRGQLSGLAARGYVYLPDGYSGASDRALRLPVVIVISDQVGGGQAAPYSAGRLSAAAASQIAAGRLAPLILVMLPARFGHRDQGCLNVPGGVQAATFFAQDLPDALRSAYRVGPQPSRWGLMGDSSGGYCALQLAMTSSAAFSAAVLPPGRYTAPPGRGLDGGSPQLRAQHNLSWLLRHQPMQPISVLFAGHGSAQPFLSLASAPMRAASTGLAGGERGLAPLLDWIGRTLSRSSQAGG
jgi:enterochelin esterase-like enzyme